MTKSSKHIIPAVLLALSLTACEDWVKPEALPVTVKTTEESDPALREQYLKNLQAYKKSDHPIVYVTFDNAAEAPLNASALVSYLPDSVDVVELTHPDLKEWFQEDMAKTQKDYGTRFVLRISYKDIMAPYGVGGSQADASEEEKAAALEQEVSALLSKVKTYGFDGITVQYDGMLPTHLKQDELDALVKKENSFLPLIAAWKAQNPDKVLYFNGIPTRTVDHTVPLAAEAIIIPSASLISATAADFEARNAANGEFEGAPMMLEVNFLPSDQSDRTTGRYLEGDSIPLMLEWMTTHTPDRYQLTGLCILHAEWDCFSGDGYYPVLRSTIKTLNPNS